MHMHISSLHLDIALHLDNVFLHKLGELIRGECHLLRRSPPQGLSEIQAERDGFQVNIKWVEVDPAEQALRPSETGL